MKFLVFWLMYFKVSLLIVYAKYQIFYTDDRIDYIMSSEGIIKTLNPRTTAAKDPSYTFSFHDILHNFQKPLCLQFINYYQKGNFAFKSASINEYDITIIKYEDFYYCNNCNLNTEKKFYTTTQKFHGSPIIKISQYQECDYISRNNTFCLYPTSDISIFFINESKINKKFYTGKTLKYILNNEFDYFNINNSFVINGNEDYIFDLNAVSFKIVNFVTLKKGVVNLYS